MKEIYPDYWLCELWGYCKKTLPRQRSRRGVP